MNLIIEQDLALSKACEYIRANLHKKITMQDLELVSEIGARSLQLKFKKILKVSPFDFIKECKLDKAYELIKANKRAIKSCEVARNLKFSHPGRFSIDFKKRFGVHPSALAKNI